MFHSWMISRETNEKKSTYVLCVGGFLFILMIRLFFWFSPTHQASMESVYVWPIAVLFTGVALHQAWMNKNHSILLALSIPVWLYITTLLGGDYYLTYNLRFIIGVFLTFGMGYSMLWLVQPKSRNKAFMTVTVGYIVAMTLMGIAGIYATVMRIKLFTPLDTTFLGVMHQRLYAFSYHPNALACAELMALLLTLYVMLAKKRWIGALLPMAIVQLVTIYLTVSRTSIILAAFGCAWCAGVYGFSACKKKVTWLRLMLSFVVGALLFCTVYGLSSPVASKLSTLIKTEASVQMGQTKANKDAHAVVERKEELDKLITFSNRTNIWKAGFTYLRQNPKALVLGTPDNIVARIPRKMGVSPEYHFHSVPMEMLMLGGIIGLVLYLAFMFMVAKACYRLFFTRDIPPAVRMLTGLPPLLTVSGLLEIHPALSGNVMDIMFLCICSMVIWVDRSYRTNTK